MLEREPEDHHPRTDSSSTLEEEPEENTLTGWAAWAEEFQELVDGPWV